MDEFLINIDENDKTLNEALKKENENLKAFLLSKIEQEAQKPFKNAYEYHLLKKYYGEGFEDLKLKQNINFKSRSINEPIKQLTRINKALKSSDEALKNVDESGLFYGLDKKLNRWSGGLVELEKERAELDNALINFANISAQVTSRGGNNSNQEREEQRLRLGGDFASKEERINRISQQRKALLDYFEAEKAGLESLGYKLDENSNLMKEYIRQKQKQEYLNNDVKRFDYESYKSERENDDQPLNDEGLKRFKKNG